MVMISVDVYKFEKFQEDWHEYLNSADPNIKWPNKARTGDSFLRYAGFKSALYNHRVGLWELSEEDYTMFLLKYER